VRLHTSLLPSLILLAACGGSSVAGTELDDQLAPEVRLQGPRGIEQHLSAIVDRSSGEYAGGPTLRIRSTLTNRGASTVHLVARSCLLADGDIESTAHLARIDRLILCAAVENAVDLAPGQSTEALEQAFGVGSGPGTYVIRIRHALDPEFRASASFRIP
jgi:hypothetical protein